MGGSLFRIAADQRYAPTAPYKTHLDFVFWEGPEGPRRAPALLLRITATDVHLGAGVPALSGTTRDAYRAALGDPDRVAELDALATTLIAGGADLNEPTRKRVPPGITPGGPAARYAVRDSLYLVRRETHPAALTTAGFVGWYAERIEPFLRFHQWLARNTRHAERTDHTGRST